MGLIVHKESVVIDEIKEVEFRSCRAQFIHDIIVETRSYT